MAFDVSFLIEQARIFIDLLQSSRRVRRTSFL